MTNKLHSLGDKYNGALTPEQARKLMEDNMKFQSGQEFNWKYTLTENQVSEAVKDYKAKHKAEFDAKMFAQLQNMTDGAVVKKPIANITEDYTHTNVYKNDKLCGSYPNTEYRGDRYNNVIGAEALRRQSEIQMFAESCAHNWQTHTTAERWGQMKVNPETLEILPPGLGYTPSEMVVTKVYCTHCLEVKDI